MSTRYVWGRYGTKKVPGYGEYRPNVNLESYGDSWPNYMFYAPASSCYISGNNIVFFFF